MWRKFQRALLAGAVMTLVNLASGALPSEWSHEQEFTVKAPGLVKLNLPADTLNSARLALEDLRLYDNSGHEVPYAIERPTPVTTPLESPRSFHVSLENNSTIITLETGVTLPLDTISLETPAADFIKGVNVEGSADGTRWRVLARHQPIFRTPSGAARLRVSFPSCGLPWLRLTVDDQRSMPVPFTGARFQAAFVEQAPVETQPAAILETNESPGQTRLTVDLGAANLDVVSIAVETDEPLFTRAVSVLEPQVTESSIHEKPIGQGVIYRIAIEGQTVSTNFTIPLDTRVAARTVTLLIRNEDSPPLRIRAVRVERRPVYLTFLAGEGGAFHLLTGNKLCPSPRYDLAGLAGRFKRLPAADVAVSAVAENPDFRPPEALRGLELTGAPLDLLHWKFRKPIRLARSGAQQLELDPDVLAHAAPDFSDVRIVSGSNQMPFIIEHTSMTRVVSLTSTAAHDARNPSLSRWAIHLPRAGLPITGLVCEPRTPLFQRQMSLYQELTDERGEVYRAPLGDATWRQTPERRSKQFALTLTETPRGDTLYLQTENGDNPPVELENFTASYTVTRALFKASAGNPFFLYYGNPQAAAPSYDLGLVAGDLLAADKATAGLEAEQPLKAGLSSENRPLATGGVVLWIALAAVVCGLLGVIARLLPKTS